MLKNIFIGISALLGIVALVMVYFIHSHISSTSTIHPEHKWKLYVVYGTLAGSILFAVISLFTKDDQSKKKDDDCLCKVCIKKKPEPCCNRPESEPCCSKVVI